MIGEDEISPARLRFMANLIDSLIVLFPMALYFSICSNLWSNALFNLSIHSLVALSSCWLLLVTFGVTPGNVITGTKVRGEQGKNPSLHELFRWNLVDLPLVFLFLFVSYFYVFQLSSYELKTVNSFHSLTLLISKKSKIPLCLQYLDLIWIVTNGVYLLIHSRRQTLADTWAKVWTVRS